MCVRAPKRTTREREEKGHEKDEKENNKDEVIQVQKKIYNVSKISMCSIAQQLQQKTAAKEDIAYGRARWYILRSATLLRVVTGSIVSGDLVMSSAYESVVCVRLLAMTGVVVLTVPLS